MVRDEFAGASDAWATRSGGYTMTYTSICGESASFTDVDTTVDVADDGTLTVIEGPDGITPLSVERVFEMLEVGLDEADLVEATYGELGNPVAVNIVWEINATDAEFCIDVSDLRLTSE